MSSATYWAGRTVRETFDSWWTINPDTGCHDWQRSLASGGYGQLNVGGSRPMGAHRFAWERANGPIPNGLHVLHRCDNRRCVNVDHLFLGTNDDNISDMHKKGRHRGGGCSGERHPSSKLTWALVLEIRAAYALGNISQRALAKTFGVAQTSIGSIVREDGWQKQSDGPVAATKQPRVTLANSFDDHWVLDEASGCWKWIGRLDEDGYGHVKVKSKRLTAHRFSYAREYGPIPFGLVVRHKCDLRSCVNPYHLELGTQADNIMDTVARGRARGGTGIRNAKAKLTPDDIREIKLRSANGESRVALSKDFAVGNTEISNIALGYVWKHVCP